MSLRSRRNARQNLLRATRALVRLQIWLQIVIASLGVLALLGAPAPTPVFGVLLLLWISIAIAATFMPRRRPWALAFAMILTTLMLICIGAAAVLGATFTGIGGHAPSSSNTFFLELAVALILMLALTRLLVRLALSIPAVVNEPVVHGFEPAMPWLSPGGNAAADVAPEESR